MVDITINRKLEIVREKLLRKAENDFIDSVKGLNENELIELEKSILNRINRRIELL